MSEQTVSTFRDNSAKFVLLIKLHSAYYFLINFSNSSIHFAYISEMHELKKKKKTDLQHDLSFIEKLTQYVLIKPIEKYFHIYRFYFFLSQTLQTNTV